MLRQYLLDHVGRDTIAIGAQTGAALLMASFLVAGYRRRGPLGRCYLLLLLSMAAGLVSSLLRVVWQLTTGSLPTGFGLVQGIVLLWVPFVVAALLAIPAVEKRRGFRMRALADGLLAASSLWYLLIGLGVERQLTAADISPAQRAQLLTSPVADVFLVATALVVYARCRPAHHRMVGWILAGLTTITAGDILFAIPDHGEVARPSSPAGMVNLVGMLLMVAAAATAGRPSNRSVSAGRRSLAEALPFLPLLVSMGLSARMIVLGHAMPAEQLLPALVVAIALMVRSLSASRDKERLLDTLVVRERELQAELRRDGLTLLGNRTYLMEALTTALEDPTAWPVVVALLDLNDFKIINDNHGHETGDAVLMLVADRLQATVRATDVVARLGGDEFAVVATNVDDGGAGLARRLLAAFEAPVTVGGRQFSLRASIGLVNGGDCESPATALACADVAMYEAKERKSTTSTIEVLSPEGRLKAARRLRLQEDIARPQLEQFRVVYQPVVELATGRLRGVEALLRWDHPTLGAVPPDLFIPIAERAGTVPLLGDFVLTTALADLASLQSQTDERLAVGVNVSPCQLTNPRFVDEALTHLARHGLHADQLNVEITEQAFEANLEAVAANLDAFAAAGVSVAVDDFGTGYSSLRYLQLLPVDVMKIDRSFICDATTSARAEALVSSIVAMASVLGLQLVAEGIETPAQLHALQGMGCELGQGYLFSKPVPIAEIEAIIASGGRFPVTFSGSVPQARRASLEALL